MAISNINLAENLTYKQVKQLQTLLVSLLPATSILFIGAVGLTQRANMHPGIFALIFVFCATGVFLGERLIISKVQDVTNIQLAELTLMCREFMAGKKDRRILVKGDDELATLVRTLNALLDQQQSSVAPEHIAHSPQPPSHVDTFLISKHLEQLVEHLKPILDGDLRVKIAVTQDEVGVVADICKSLVEKLVQFTRWTLYSSTQILDAARHLLKYSTTLAQKIEVQAQHLLNVNSALEKLGASVYQLDNHLHVSVETARQLHTSLKQQQGPVVITEVNYPGPPHLDSKNIDRNKAAKETKVLMDAKGGNSEQDSITPKGGDIAKIQKQVKLQGESLRITKKQTAFVDAIHGEIDFVAQHLHRISTDLLKSSSTIHTLIALAEDWQRQSLALDLPEENESEEDEFLLTDEFLL